MILLRVEKLFKAYGAFVALHPMTFDVCQGDFISLIGPSGCGKSTLLKLLCGVEEPTSGSVKLHDEAVSRLAPAEQAVLLVWQSLALFRHLDVAGNVGFGLSVRGVDHPERRVRVAEALELVGLGGFEERGIGTLSGGEQQRVALARALVLRPSVLLLDEPLRGLDRHLRGRLIETIRGLHRRLGVTIVMVTHDHTEAMALATRVAVMRAGKIEQFASPADILQHPATAFVARFVGDRNVFRGQIREGGGKRVVVTTAGGDLQAVIPGWSRASASLHQDVAYVIDSHRVTLGADRENSVAARVEAVLDDGAAEVIELDGGPLRTVRCRRPVLPGNRLVTVGEEVQLCWHSDDAYVLPE